MSNHLYIHIRIQINSYNRLERKDTYNVIGIMKGEIEPGIRTTHS